MTTVGRYHASFTYQAGSWSKPRRVVAPQLQTLAYKLANFLRTLALPEAVKHWSLTTLRQRLVKIAHCSGPASARLRPYGQYLRPDVEDRRPE